MNDHQESVAIVAMTGRFPGSASVDEYWRNLQNGYSGIRHFTPEEMVEDGADPSLIAHPSHVPAGAPLTDIDQFDAEFFGIPSHEAKLMDPQQRIFLELCWRALQEAGHPPARFEGRIGVFGAVSISSYLLNLLSKSETVPEDGISYPILLGNDKDFVATRTSHKLGLTGPALTVQTACSSSLVAVHLAMQSLLAGECDLALAGGVSVSVPEKTGYIHREGGILSADGHCRVFDQNASGTVRGSGGGVVALRRMEDTARDTVHAVIRASATNNDGDSKMSFTAPSADGQAEVIREAMEISGVPNEDIGYVEAHGTGTALGDPIELRGLLSAYEERERSAPACYLGSVKANIGHLDVAAGVAGLIKTALVLRDQTIPVQPDFNELNPQIEKALNMFRIPERTQFLERPLRAASVSSFGLGGTNAHLVLTPAPATSERAAPTPSDRLFLLSAKNEQALREGAQRLSEHMRSASAPRLDDVALTLAEGRVAESHRGAVRASDRVGLVNALEELAQLGTSAPAPVGAERWCAGEDAQPHIGEHSQAMRVPLPPHVLSPIRHWPDLPQVETDQESRTPRPVLVEDSSLEKHVLATIERILELPEIDTDDDLIDLGLDSLRAVDIVTELRDSTGATFTFERFDAVSTPREVIDVVRSTLPPGESTPETATPSTPGDVSTRSSPLSSSFSHLLVKIRQGSEEKHAFFVPPAGGTTIVYADLARHISDEYTLWSFNFPGVSAQSQHWSIRDLARLYTELLRDAGFESPYVLGGYSFGGNVAFEMAIQIEKGGGSVERLIMLDSHPPEAYIGGSANEEDFVEIFPVLTQVILHDQPTRSADAEPVSSIEDFVNSLDNNSWSESLKKELIRFFHIWQENHKALKRWYPEVQLDADTVILSAQESESSLILDRLDIKRVGSEAWKEHTNRTPEVIEVPGDHYSMLRDSANLPALGKAMEKALKMGFSSK